MRWVQISHLFLEWPWNVNFKVIYISNSFIAQKEVELGNFVTIDLYRKSYMVSLSAPSDYSVRCLDKWSSSSLFQTLYLRKGSGDMLLNTNMKSYMGTPVSKLYLSWHWEITLKVNWILKLYISESSKGLLPLITSRKSYMGDLGSPATQSGLSLSDSCVLFLLKYFVEITSCGSLHWWINLFFFQLFFLQLWWWLYKQMCYIQILHGTIQNLDGRVSSTQCSMLLCTNWEVWTISNLCLAYVGWYTGYTFDYEAFLKCVQVQKEFKFTRCRGNDIVDMRILV